MITEDAWDWIRAGGRQIAEVLQATTERIDHLLAEGARFGERGWPLNPEWDSAELADLVDALGEAECDDVFVAFYEADDGARIRHMFSDLAKSASMNRWQLIIRQSEQALERDHHALVVPALMTVLEGRVFTGTTTSTWVKGEVERHLKAQQDSFSRMVWQTILDYVNALFANSNFKDDEPHFNRHWILHGRASPGWGRADVVRLLHGIYTIDLALSNPA